MRVGFMHQPLGGLSIPVKEGSIAIWTYEVARRLAKSHEAIVYSSRNADQEEVETLEGVTYRRLVHSADSRVSRVFEEHPKVPRWLRLDKRNRPLFASCVTHLEYGLKVAADLKKRRCDLVHINNFSQFVPVVRALNPKIKIVLHMQAEWLTQLDRRMVASRLRKCDLILGCSHYLVDKVRSRFPEFASRCHVVHNGVDMVSFAPSNGHGDGTRSGGKRLLFVGRISPEKGLHVLLEAFKNVSERYPGTEITIVGPEWTAPLEFIVKLSNDQMVLNLARFYPESYLKQLRRMLSPEQLRRVSFLPNVSYVEAAACYRRSDVLVNPSLLETFGMSLVEGMATGLAVVGTQVGGMMETVENGKSGILVEPANATALTEALIRLLGDDRLRESMGRAGRERAALFSWDKVAQDALRYYEEVAGQRRTVN